MVRVDLAAYVKAIGKQMPQGGLAMQFALRISQWGRWWHHKIDLNPDATVTALILARDAGQGLEGKWWLDAGQ